MPVRQQAHVTCQHSPS